MEGGVSGLLFKHLIFGFCEILGIYVSGLKFPISNTFNMLKVNMQFEDAAA